LHEIYIFEKKKEGEEKKISNSIDPKKKNIQLMITIKHTLLVLDNYIKIN
jgi:hypothetical protein